MIHHMSVLLLVAAAATSDAPARERNFTMRGDGWFDTGNARFGQVAMREARLTLRDNGYFAVTLFVRNERYLVRGRWDGRGNGNVERFTIEDAFGRRADGNGTLFFGRDDDGPRRITLNGRTSAGPFRAELAVDRRDRRDDRGRDDDDWRDDNRRRDGDWGRGRAFESNDRGEGWLRQDIGPSMTFDRMRVTLAADRDAVIRLEGRRQTLHLRGTWRDSGNGVTIELSGVNELRAWGRLELRRDGRRVRSLDGNGRTEMGRFEVQFR